MKKEVRVRFAPSPTGGLHLGGVRTALYNYLFAKKNNGKFILRIEDTDQNRYVDGAEKYILDCLQWCGIEPDESPLHGGDYAPYRQSERKANYKEYAEQLIQNGYAYYAFDTAAELEKMRQDYKTHENPTPQYDHKLRLKMRNSLTLSKEEIKKLLAENTPYVIRFKNPENEEVVLNDMIRGKVSFNTSLLDDKVLLKADGMPTYHLAVVVDDFQMKISHIFRGEEWLPSAPIHILLWKYLFGEENIPDWVHLPLILGPNGKLSKRDGAKYGFPVYAMNWEDKAKGELTEGFNEKGFLPEAFINFLALLGWNDGTEQEIFTKEELCKSFSVERIHSGGAKFDYEKAKWFNHEWIMKLSAKDLLQDVKTLLQKNNITITDEKNLQQLIELVKDRCQLVTDFVEQLNYFYQTPENTDTSAIEKKWSETKTKFFQQLSVELKSITAWDKQNIEEVFNKLANEFNIKPGEVMLPFRIMLVGGKFGPGVFDIASFLLKEEVIKRINNVLDVLK